jgi:uncharacterized membrane protein YcaP (DUF421 family)
MTFGKMGKLNVRRLTNGQKLDKRRYLMELDWIWKAILIIVVGTLLLRVAGRKSISQMTLAQTVVMIGIGSLLIQPVAGKNLWVTFMVAGVLVVTLIVMEYLQVKSDLFEKFITGKSKVLIDNGTMQTNTLKKLRLTVDQLEMQLRQTGITKMSDVQYATLEPNGRLGYTLKESAQYATKEDIQKVLELIKQRLPYVKLVPDQIQPPNVVQAEPSQETNLFTEVVNKSHQNPPPKRLQ